MREIRPYGSAGGGTELNQSSLPRSKQGTNGDFSIATGTQRLLVWWSVFMVCSREGPWASPNMSSAIRPLIVA
jgi:hypothetical protein